MVADVGLPIQMIGKDRDETLIVYFDGFIKNETESVIRTMLRDEDIWTKKYPGISQFRELNTDELYYETMLFRPYELLAVLSKDKLSEEEIMEDLDQIIPNIIFENSKITSFEFALYKILNELNITKCYIFKDTDFYDVEVEYIKRQYADVIDKITFVSGGIIQLIREANPTTICLLDPILPLRLLPDNFTEEELDNKAFIVLNSGKNIEIDDDTHTMYYSKEFSEKMLEINDEGTYGVLAMFNIPFVTEDEENDDENE